MKPKIVLAPMLKITTPHFRNLISIISPNTHLFTEMIVANTVIHSNVKHRLGNPFNTTVQLGGSDPILISNAVKIIKEEGFTKFNLNCGCPSTKVKKGCFGAILMTMPDLVVEIINRVYNDTGIVLSIKCRIGVDDHDSFDFFYTFIDKIMKNTKCRSFYVHCRKCLLDGISPKDNKNVPRLNYEFAERIYKMYDDIEIYINGGIKGFHDMKHEVTGYMIGREGVKNPFVFEEIEKKINKKNIIDDSYKENCFMVDKNNFEENLENRKKNTIEAKNNNNLEDNYILEKNIYELEDLACLIKNHYSKDYDLKFERIRNVIHKYLSLYNSKIDSFIAAPLMQLFHGKKGVKEYKKIINDAVVRKIDVSILQENLRQFFDSI